MERGVIGTPGTLVLEELVASFEVSLLDPTLTLSMELYCSALLETNERARFVTVVSALEPLAKQEALGEGVAAFVDSTVAKLNAALDIESNLRASLRGRVDQLRSESVRQALFRMADSWFPGRAEQRKQIDHAYGVRSELLHNGFLSDFDSDLSEETNKIATILRSIYAQASHRSFHVHAGI